MILINESIAVPVEARKSRESAAISVPELQRFFLPRPAASLRDFPETIRALNPRTASVLSSPSLPSQGGEGRGEEVFVPPVAGQGEYQELDASVLEREGKGLGKNNFRCLSDKHTFSQSSFAHPNKI